MQIVIRNYTNTQYQFIAYFEHDILSIPLYNNIQIEIDFIKFYKNVDIFAIYQEEEYYDFALKVYDEYYYRPCYNLN